MGPFLIRLGAFLESRRRVPEPPPNAPGDLRGQGWSFIVQKAQKLVLRGEGADLGNLPLGKLKEATPGLGSFA